MPENTDISLSRRSYSFISNSSARQLPTTANATETTSQSPAHLGILAQLQELESKRKAESSDEDEDDGAHVNPGAISILSPRQRNQAISIDDDTQVNASPILQTDPPTLRAPQSLPPTTATTEAAAAVLPLASIDQLTDQGKSDHSTTHDGNKRRKISPITLLHSSVTPVEQPSVIYPNTFQTRPSQLQKTTPPPGENKNYFGEILIDLIKARGVENLLKHGPEGQRPSQPKSTQEPRNKRENQHQPSIYHITPSESIQPEGTQKRVDKVAAARASAPHQSILSAKDVNRQPSLHNKPRDLKRDLAPERKRRKPKDEPELTGNIQLRNEVYTILNTIGHGGSSAVYRVLHHQSKQIQALKRVNTLSLPQETIIQYKSEITILSRLNRKKCTYIPLMYNYEHNRETGNIDLILELGEVDFAIYLHDQKTKRLNLNFVRWYGQQMLESIAEIHNLNLIHRDIKPANFIIQNGTLKLIDFGISKYVHPETKVAHVETPMGTVSYMAPETFYDDRSRRKKYTVIGLPCDIWAFGCLLYQMVYGHTPFHDVPADKKSQHIMDKTIPIKYPSMVTFRPKTGSDENVIIGETTIDVLKHCLSRDPATRLSAKALLDHAFFHPS